MTTGIHSNLVTSFSGQEWQRSWQLGKGRPEEIRTSFFSKLKKFQGKGEFGNYEDKQRRIAW
jgi:hypothetical protein